MRNSRATTACLASSHLSASITTAYLGQCDDKAPVEDIDRLAPVRARAEQGAQASKTPQDANSSVCSADNMSSACRPLSDRSQAVVLSQPTTVRRSGRYRTAWCSANPIARPPYTRRLPEVDASWWTGRRCR